MVPLIKFSVYVQVSMYRNDLIKNKHTNISQLRMSLSHDAQFSSLLASEMWSSALTGNKQACASQVAVYSLCQRHNNTEKQTSAWPRSFSQHSSRVLCQISLRKKKEQVQERHLTFVESEDHEAEAQQRLKAAAVKVEIMSEIFQKPNRLSVNTFAIQKGGWLWVNMQIWSTNTGCRELRACLESMHAHTHIQAAKVFQNKWLYNETHLRTSPFNLSLTPPVHKHPTLTHTFTLNSSHSSKQHSFSWNSELRLLWFLTGEIKIMLNHFGGYQPSKALKYLPLKALRQKHP